MGIKIVTTHSGADFDALASLLAASKLYRDAFVFLPGSPERKVRNYLETEKFPGKLCQFREIKNKTVDLLVVTDTRHASRIGRIKELIDKNTRIHLYDHHPETEKDMNGEINEKKKYGATTTIMVEKLKQEAIPLSPHEATLMTMGIYEDTGCLTYPMTTPEDLMAVSYLLTRGADLSVVSSHVINTLTEEQVMILNTFLQNKEIFKHPQGTIAFVSASPEKYVEDLSVAVQKAAEILKPRAIFALVKLESKVLCVMRSDGRKFNAGNILKNFGGGGHRTAASAIFEDTSIADVKEKILKFLKQKNIGSEFSILKPPVKVIPENDTVLEAYRALIHMGWDFAPAGNEAGLLRGIIEKDDLEKAIRHGLANHPAIEFMHTGIVTVDREDRKEIMRKFADTGSPFVIIKKDGKIKSFAARNRPIEVKDNKAKQSNLRKMLEKLPEGVYKILDVSAGIALREGISIYCAGGMVRDILMGIEHKDVDIVAEKNGIEFAKKLGAKLGGRVHSHKKFNTAVIDLPDRKIDIATLRKEYYTLPAALPDIETGTLLQDLKRRDFTINAMAMQLSPEKDFGRLIDFFGGKKDIEEGVIRILYPLSFVEDPTRIFRAVRFSKRFGFRISSETMKQIKKSIHMEIHLGLSSDRVKEEILNIMNENNPHRIFKTLYSLGALDYLHRDIKITPEISSLLKKLSGTADYIAMISVLLKELPEEEGLSVLKKFNFSKKYIETYQQLKRKLKEAEKILEVSISPARIYKTCSVLTESALEILLNSDDPRVRKNVRLYKNKLKGIKPLTGGKKLMEMGYKPSPLLSEITNTLKAAKLNGKIKTAGEEELFIKENFPRS